MGSIRRVKLGENKYTEQCRHCSGKGCSQCDNCGQFEIIEDLMRDEYYDDNGHRNRKLDDDWERIASKKPFKKGGCYITTATCKTLGKNDDCYELNKFREFRDNWMNEFNSNLIKEYYQIAPKIVEEIEKRLDSDAIFNEIWTKYLSIALRWIELKSFNKALQTYSIMVFELKKQYLIDDSKSNN